LLRDLPEIARLLARQDHQTAATLVEGIAEKPRERKPRGTIGPHQHAQVWKRDQFTCGYCERRVIPPIVMRCISAHFPDEFTYQRNWKGAHSAYWTISAATDHRNPYARHGKSGLSNLACACWACNQRKREPHRGRSRYALQTAGDDLLGRAH
jgi:5-methylcytosine-specific restriction endonuclease McrA